MIVTSAGPQEGRIRSGKTGQMFRRVRAFNLLELMLALNLFACIVTALCFLWAQHARFQKQTLTYALADQLAQTLLNQQVSLGYLGQAPPDQTVRMKLTSDGVPADIPFQCHVTVVDRSLTTVDLRQISVDVSWTQAGIPRKISVATLLYWNG